MRVCIVLSTSPTRWPSGGVEKATETLCHGLSAAGHDVTLVAGGDEGDEGWPGVRTVRLPHTGRRMLAGGAREWYALVGRTLDELRPDVAVGEGLGFAGGAVVRWRGPARVVVAHGSYREDLRYAYSRLGKMLRAPLLRVSRATIVKRADAVANVTPEWRVNCPVAPRRQVHIPNAVDGEFFVQEWRPVPGRVVCFGGPKRIKGVDLLLEAWPHVLRRVPGACLDLYGDVPDMYQGLPRGCSAREALATSSDIADAMARASVVVLPSRFEVSPLIAAEAMAVGVPVVATDVGGVRAMTEGVAGLCAPDAREIAAVTASALTEPSVWGGRVREGRRRSADYTVERVAAAFTALFESLSSA